MTASAVPKYISLIRAAKLYGGKTAHVMYAKIARKEVASENIGGTPFVLFDSLPDEQRHRYVREESAPKTKRRAKR